MHKNTVYCLVNKVYKPEMWRCYSFDDDIDHNVYHHKNPEVLEILFQAKNSVSCIMNSSFVFVVISVNFFPLLLGNIHLVEVKYASYVDLVPVF